MHNFAYNTLKGQEYMVTRSENDFKVQKPLLAFSRHLAFLGMDGLVTPPDVISQIMISVPLIMFFEISLLIVRITGESGKQKKDKNNSL